MTSLSLLSIGRMGWVMAVASLGYGWAVHLGLFA